METMKVILGRSKLKRVPISVPLNLLNEYQAKWNHNQTLDKLKERGGMSVLEILCNVDNKKLEFRSPKQKDVDRLNSLIAEFLTN